MNNGMERKPARRIFPSFRGGALASLGLIMAALSASAMDKTCEDVTLGDGEIAFFNQGRSSLPATPEDRAALVGNLAQRSDALADLISEVHYGFELFTEVSELFRFHWRRVYLSNTDFKTTGYDQTGFGVEIRNDRVVNFEAVLHFFVKFSSDARYRRFMNHLRGTLSASPGFSGQVIPHAYGLRVDFYGMGLANPANRQFLKTLLLDPGFRLTMSEASFWEPPQD
jgi:hypothetical protein